MKNKILALKYRPQEFKDLIGQEAMSQTITNAIKLNKTPNAYLLTGIRGVGKTTTAVNLGASLGILEKNILLVDADPQANASSGLGINNKDLKKGTYQLLEHTLPVEKTIVSTNSINLDLIPSHIDLVASEIELVDKNKREYMLKSAISSVEKKYDFIILDCAP